MRTNTIYLLELAKRIRRRIAPTSLNRNGQLVLSLDCFGQEASDLIKSKISDDEPRMICRFGSAELSATITYLNATSGKSILRKSLDYIINDTEPFWWEDNLRDAMRNNAGFFPTTDDSLAAFGSRMIDDIQNIDVLGSVCFLRRQELELLGFMKRAFIVDLTDLEPYYHKNPWSEALDGKVVLVIHPFEQSIQQQYRRRRLLFKDARVLPEFELKTLKSIQSIAGNDVGFNTWFDALDCMCEKVAHTQFDVAIIGAGAYGLSLASHVKKLGKKSIQLGGATQILFGIKGKRWDERRFFQELYNEYWIRPSFSEMPKNYQNIEGGCYW
jgi:hypothetical protein